MILHNGRNVDHTGGSTRSVPAVGSSPLPSFSLLDLLSAPGRQLLNQVSRRASPALAAVSDRLARAFEIKSPFAPAFCCIGAEVELEARAAAANGSSRLSVTGNGETAAAALTSCLGEAADLLSQFERDGDIAAQGASGELEAAIAQGWIAAAGVTPARGIDWIAAVEAGSGRRVLLPADLCLRRAALQRAVEPVGALSSGAAAGPDKDGAALRAVLELCERDAAALWWLGGRLPLYLAENHPAGAAATALVERLRRGQSGRRTAVLDITTDLGVPAIAATSMDDDGRSFACGVAARLDPIEAAVAAVLELFQMELSAPVAAAKLAERGEAGLNDADRRHLARAAFAAGECALLRPVEASRLEAFPVAAGSVLDGLTTRLEGQGIAVYLADLSRADLGVSVMRAVAPHLQPFSGAVTTQRLLRSREICGSPGRRVTAVSLF